MQRNVDEYAHHSTSLHRGGDGHRQLGQLERYLRASDNQMLLILLVDAAVMHRRTQIQRKAAGLRHFHRGQIVCRWLCV